MNYFGCTDLGSCGVLEDIWVLRSNPESLWPVNQWPTGRKSRQIIGELKSIKEWYPTTAFGSSSIIIWLRWARSKSLPAQGSSRLYTACPAKRFYVRSEAWVQAWLVFYNGWCFSMLVRSYFIERIMYEACSMRWSSSVTRRNRCQVAALQQLYSRVELMLWPLQHTGWVYNFWQDGLLVFHDPGKWSLHKCSKQ